MGNCLSSDECEIIESSVVPIKYRVNYLEISTSYGEYMNKGILSQDVYHNNLILCKSHDIYEASISLNVPHIPNARMNISIPSSMFFI